LVSLSSKAFAPPTDAETLSSTYTCAYTKADTPTDTKADTPTDTSAYASNRTSANAAYHTSAYASTNWLPKKLSIHDPPAYSSTDSGANTEN
jgi:hypothetical protein